MELIKVDARKLSVVSTICSLIILDLMDGFDCLQMEISTIYDWGLFFQLSVRYALRRGAAVSW